MFDILVYLYETYYRPDACPDSMALAKKLSAVGFEEDEIIEALGWLSALAETTNKLAQATSIERQIDVNHVGFRIYTTLEQVILGAAAIGFIQYLQNTQLIDPQQREVIIERAMAINEAPVPVEKLKVIILMMLWSQGSEPDMLMFDTLLLSEIKQDTKSLH